MWKNKPSEWDKTSSPSPSKQQQHVHHPHGNVVHLNKFHSVPVVLHLGDRPGLPSTMKDEHSKEVSSLLCEPLVDKRGLDATRMLERLGILSRAKTKAAASLEEAREHVVFRTMQLMQAGDAVAAACSLDPSDRRHSEATAAAFAELRTLKQEVDYYYRLFTECDQDIVATERQLKGLYDSRELLLVERDRDEIQREHAMDEALQQEQETESTTRRQEGTHEEGGNAAVASSTVDSADEKSALERLNHEAASLPQLELTLRMLRAPHYAKTEVGGRIIALVTAIQCCMRRFRVRKRYLALKRLRRNFDFECKRYYFYFYRRYVAAVTAHRRHLLRLGFYPLLGNANLAVLRRGAFIMHAMRARELATVQRVFLLWRHVTRYFQAPIAPALAPVSSTRHISRRSSLSLDVTDQPELSPSRPWWMRDFADTVELPQWGVFLHYEHIRQIMKRIALPVFGGCANHFLTFAWCFAEWKAFVAAERRARISWDIAVSHHRRMTKSKHFRAWMDVVSFTMQKDAREKARKMLYFGIWRRYVQRDKRERQALVAMIPVKKLQILNRWRQRVVRLRLERIASNIRLFVNRPTTLLAVYCLQHDRTQTAFIKCWRDWKAYTQRRIHFKSIVGMRWVKRKTQLQQVIFQAWRTVTKTGRAGGGCGSGNMGLSNKSFSSAHMTGAAGGRGGGGGSASSSLLFSTNVQELQDDCRVLDVRRLQYPHFRAFHQAQRRLADLGPPLTVERTRMVPTDRGGYREQTVSETLQCNPQDLFIKETVTMISLQDMEKERDAEHTHYQDWFALHGKTTTVRVPRGGDDQHNTVARGGVGGDVTEDGLYDTRTHDDESHGGYRGGYGEEEVCRFKDSHFLCSMLQMLWVQHKRQRQLAAYQQQYQQSTPSSGVPHPAVSSSSEETAKEDNAGSSSNPTAGQQQQQQQGSTLSALSFALAVAFPFVQATTSEWNVVEMEHFFEDHCRFNMILQTKKHSRDARIGRKITMRLAALRFAETNPFFTCHALTARNIGFSPFQYLLDQYTAQRDGNKKGGSKKKKSKKKGGGSDSPSPAGSPTGTVAKLGKFFIPLPPVPVKKQLPFLLRLHLHEIVESPEIMERMQEHKYVRAKIQLVGCLMRLACLVPNTKDTLVADGVAMREGAIQKLSAFEEKEFRDAVLATKMHDRVDVAMRVAMERIPVEVQVLNLVSFNPKFLRGAMQAKTKKIGKTRAFMRAQQREYEKIMKGRLSLLPVHEWQRKKARIELVIDELEEEGLRERNNYLTAGDDESVPGEAKGCDTAETTTTARRGNNIANNSAGGLIDLRSTDTSSEGGTDSDDDHPHQPTRTSTFVHLSEAAVVVDRNKILKAIHKKLPNSCPDSPTERVLEIILPPPPTPPPEVETNENSEAAEAAAGLDIPTVALPQDTPRPDEGDESTPTPADTGSAALTPKLQESVPVDTPRTAMRKQLLAEISSEDDDDDDDEAMIAARKVQRSGKAPRTLAERQKSQQSIFGKKQSTLQSQSTPIVTESVQRTKDEEEMMEEGAGGAPDDKATVDAFACAAMSNGMAAGIEGASQSEQHEPVSVDEEGVQLLHDGSFRIANGTQVVPGQPGQPAKIVLPNGTIIFSGGGEEGSSSTGGAEVVRTTETFEVLPNGKVKLHDGRVVPLGFVEVVDGNLRLQSGCLLLADGNVVRMDKKAYRVDGKVRLANGRLVDSTKVAKDANGNLILASQKFLVHTLSSTVPQKVGRRPSSAGSSASASTRWQDEGEDDEEDMDAESAQWSSHNKDGGFGSLHSGSMRMGDKSLKRRMRRCPRLWEDTQDCVPAMERLLEITGRFSNFLNATTQRQLKSLQASVLRAVSKLDPDVRRAAAEVAKVGQTIAGLTGQASTTDANMDRGEAAPVAVPPTEFVMRHDPPRPATVTIEHAKHRSQQRAAAAASAPSSKRHLPPPGGDGDAEVKPASADDAVGDFVNAETFLRKHPFQRSEAQMILIDTQPVRRAAANGAPQGDVVWDDDERRTMAAMQSTADLMNDAYTTSIPGGDTGSTSLPASQRLLPSQLVGTPALTAIEAEVLRRHAPRRASFGGAVGVAHSRPPTSEGTRPPATATGATASTTSARLPSKLRSVVTKVASQSPPEPEQQDDFALWLHTVTTQLNQPRTFDAAKDELEGQSALMQRQLHQLRHSSENSSDDAASGSRARETLLRQLQDRLDQVLAVLQQPRPLSTTTELFDCAITKRSFTPRFVRPSSTASTGGSQQRNGAVNESQPVGVPPSVAAEQVEPLRDSEVARLVSFIQSAQGRSTAKAQ